MALREAAGVPEDRPTANVDGSCETCDAGDPDMCVAQCNRSEYSLSPPDLSRTSATDKGLMRGELGRGFASVWARGKVRGVAEGSMSYCMGIDKCGCSHLLHTF